MEYLIWQCQAAIENNGGIMLSLFLAGLLGSVNHCAGMCGPFVVAQMRSEVPDQSTIMKRIKGAALLPYHTGRLTTYAVLGVISASLSQFIVGSPIQRGVAFVLLALAGLLFLMSAFPDLKKMAGQMISKTRGGTQPSISPSLVGSIIGKASRPFFAKQSVLHQYVLGMLLGFMPCALVLAAIMAVASTGTPVTAALGMVLFGLGTVPALVSVGIFAKAACVRWPDGMKQISTGIMAVNGVGLMVLASGMVK